MCNRDHAGFGWGVCGVCFSLGVVICVVSQGVPCGLVGAVSWGLGDWVWWFSCLCTWFWGCGFLGVFVGGWFV